MPGPGRKPATEATLRMPPLRRFKAVDEGERQLGQRAHVEIDHRELLGAIERRRRPEQAEARIVDDDLRLDAVPSASRDLARRIPRRCRSSAATSGRGGRRSRQSRRRAHRAAARAAPPAPPRARWRRTRGRARADAGRRTGDQRDRALAARPRSRRFGPSRFATRWRSSMRSRAEMPSRSAARQIRLSSNSVTRPSA